MRISKFFYTKNSDSPIQENSDSKPSLKCTPMTFISTIMLSEIVDPFAYLSL